MSNDATLREALEQMIEQFSANAEWPADVAAVNFARAALAQPSSPQDATPPTEQAAVPAQLDPSVIRRLAHQYVGGVCLNIPFEIAAVAPTEQVAPPNKLGDEEIAITIGEICGFMRAHEITGNSHRKAIEVVRALVVKYAAAPESKDAADARRWRYLESRAYEAVVPHGQKINDSREAWATHLYAGRTFAEAVDAAVAALAKQEGK